MPITTSLKTGRYSEMTHLETTYVGRYLHRKQTIKIVCMVNVTTRKWLCEQFSTVLKTVHTCIKSIRQDSCKVAIVSR